MTTPSRLRGANHACTTPPTTFVRKGARWCCRSSSTHLQDAPADERLHRGVTSDVVQGALLDKNDNNGTRSHGSGKRQVARDTLNKVRVRVRVRFAVVIAARTNSRLSTCEFLWPAVQ